MNSDIKKNIDAIFKKLKKRFYQIAMKYVDEIMCEMYQELVKIYDECIDQYYLYRTKSYYRHDVGVGTGTGINLYRGQQIHMQKHGKHYVNIVVGWDGSEMESYRHVTTDFVLENVMDGIRGLRSGGKPGSSQRWVADIQTKYIGRLRATPNEIFKEYLDKSGEIKIKIYRTKEKRYLDELYDACVEIFGI